MDYYTRNADTLFQRYQALPAQEVHRCWQDLLPPQPGLACDIGAGSGRDAQWLASLGWNVTAVEPNAALRTRGETHTNTLAPRLPGSITWLDDSLPDLTRLRALDQRYTLILISAVWMHLLPTQHARAMRIVSELLAPGGLLIISLRQGPDAEGRFHPIAAKELTSIAETTGLRVTRNHRNTDLLRPDITWEYLLLTHEILRPK